MNRQAASAAGEGAAELPATYQAALPFGAAHCSIVAQLVFPEMLPRGEIRSQGKGAGTFLAAQRSCQAMPETGAAAGHHSPARGKPSRQAPEPGLCLPAPTPGAAAPLQTFVCKPRSRDALPWHFPPALFYTIRY